MEPVRSVYGSCPTRLSLGPLSPAPRRLRISSIPNGAPLISTTSPYLCTTLDTHGSLSREAYVSQAIPPICVDLKDLACRPAIPAACPLVPGYYTHILAVGGVVCRDQQKCNNLPCLPATERNQQDVTGCLEVGTCHWATHPKAVNACDSANPSIFPIASILMLWRTNDKHRHLPARP